MTGRLNNHTDDWGLVLRNGAAGDNASSQSAIGSAYLNDIYIRASGKWASQMSSDSGTLCGSWNNISGVSAYCQGHNPGSSCPAGYGMVVSALTYGGCCGYYSYSCAKY